MKQRGFAPIIILIIIAVGIVGYFAYKNFPIKPQPSTAEECIKKTTCEGPTPCMANPASVFCTCMGGELEIRENNQGQYGVCKIEGKEYDEWEYFRKMAPAEGKFCGGFAGVDCPSGYTCRLEGNYPDAGGTCVKD